MSFATDLEAKAKKNVKTIVLPEGEDDRILQAANEVLSKSAVDLVVLGDEKQILARAAELGLKNVGDAKIIDPEDPELQEKAVAKFVEVRKASAVKKAEKQGVKFDEAAFLEEANKSVQDISTFATLLVKLGLADGMVSGAIHTTADTIRPALQIIKTKPGRKTVSGAFFMCIPSPSISRAAEQVLLYADCAVNPNPEPEIVADIALASDETAKQFGLESRIALLSYSTGTSGKGQDVDATNLAVKELERLASEGQVAIEFEGPIQYDAATDPDVAKIKMPDSKVAGRATVFVFPDLKSGNITYKAVQRSSGALAIGPVLQGLNAPVNDLSRGALVEDIVNTIYLTAVQAQG
ncbi:MAG: phosphate acetyltransferase [Candidatus Ancillula sp.]|jgi:phosphate acetyltransferase|nr:phosphate acetyltransferase [Candidatus Ancillula sp.]